MSCILRFHISFFYCGLFSRTHELYKTCEVVTAPAKYQYEALAMAMSKNSPFLELFNYQLTVFKENGVLDQIRNKYDPPPQVCPDFSGKPLGLGSVLAAFVPLAFSAIFGLFLMILECFCKKVTWIDLDFYEETLNDDYRTNCNCPCQCCRSDQTKRRMTKRRTTE